MTIPTRPALTVQTASLWSTGDNDVFSGTGGPFGYDPFFGQFGGVISSDGLDAEPFQDQLWNVSAGDLIVFVIAVQNRGSQDAYDVLLHDTMPAGFAAPDGDPGMSVTDGAGNLLNFSGSLFDPGGGLLIQDPVSAYDPASGANVALITFTLEATSQLAIPFAALSSTVQIDSYADAPGDPSLTSNDAPSDLQASTGLGTAGIVVGAAADQSLVSLNSFQQASFDVTLILPPGEVTHLNIQDCCRTRAMPGSRWSRLRS